MIKVLLPIRRSKDRPSALVRYHPEGFHLSLIALPGAKRQAIASLHTFTREVTTEAMSSHSPAEAATLLAHHRTRLGSCLDGVHRDGLMQKLGQMIATYNIPANEIEALIDHVELDLRPRRHQSWSDLAAYCQLATGNLNRIWVRILGSHHPQALRHANNLGVAMHLTRILRTARADAMQGRFYLPLDEMNHFELTESEMRGVRPGMGWERIVAYQSRRARLLFKDGLRVCDYLPIYGAAWIRMVAGLSHRLLERIASNPRRALNHGVYLPARDKLEVAMRSCLPV